VFREIGPLAAAVVVILRTGTAISAEMAVMRISGQTRALNYLGIDLYEYLVLPRVAGVMLATVALTLYIQFLAVFGGLVLSPFIIEASFTELTGRLFDLFTPIDFAYSIIKSFLFGFAIAAACCWHGLNPPDLTQNSVPKVVTRAVTQSAMLVLLINAVFAYLVFGILFFGLVKANL
jgi:phospholipid/cholesterol/gamma-HCH transport system permease protein